MYQQARIQSIVFRRQVQVDLVGKIAEKIVSRLRIGAHLQLLRGENRLQILDHLQQLRLAIAVRRECLHCSILVTVVFWIEHIRVWREIPIASRNRLAPPVSASTSVYGLESQVLIGHGVNSVRRF